ncbi:hypothetical protein QLQ15_09455 [Lysobacter sp. LF1]|uniref:DUF1471 domain-containing protein n=1 Tax=Lysobacter stagni TaxID=3045172 RepID=A0ABT6XH87_9GAMM|nr:hypothetical protein [Lysobacter sp. LF1]MDI9239135.1 hypothetical protein [Lysobacter sp. LF1]
MATPRWLCAIALFLAVAQASAQSATISFRGAIVEGTTSSHDAGDHAQGSAGDAPRRSTTQALNAIAAPRGEILDYFARRSQEAGIATGRLYLVTVDYL